MTVSPPDTDSGPEAGPESLLAILETTRSSFSELLVGPAEYARLAEACSLLPSRLATFWGVETRLGDARPAVDLLVEVKRGSPGHALLADASAPPLNRLCREWPVWHALRLFAARWADGGTYADLQNLWLEFDIAAATSPESLRKAVGEPCLFWGPKRGTTRRPALLNIFPAAIGAFYDLEIDTDMLRRIAGSLPSGAQLFQLGAMGSRDDAVVRLCANRMTVEEIVRWLQAIEWPGDLTRLAADLAALAPLTHALAVNIDIQRGAVAEKIGIECYMDWAKEEAEQWKPLLGRLAVEGLCLEDKRRAIERFPARTKYTLHQQLSRRQEGIVYPFVICNVHHLKLNHLGGRFTEAKGYLGVYRPGVRFDFLYGGKGADESPDGWYVA